MVAIGIDMGGATRNGICVMNEHHEILHRESIEYDKSNHKGTHRRNIASKVKKLVLLYNADMVLVERVKQFKGDKHSPIENIESLARMVCAILDNCFDLCEIFDVQVSSWKSQILGHNTKDKQESIDYVYNKYKINVEHDEADSICIATYGIENFGELMYDLAPNPKYKMVGSKCLTKS